MKKYLYLIATIFLTGCINFNPNGNNAETSEDASIDMVDDSADELTMQNSPHQYCPK